MKENHPKISLANWNKEEDPNFMNFVVMTESGEILSDLSFQEPFLLEGVFFALCIKGTAEITVNSKEYHLSPDTVLLLQPGQLIHVTKKSDDFLVESLYISLDFFIGQAMFKDLQHFFKVYKSPCVQVTREVSQNLLEYYAFIVKRYRRQEAKYKDNIMQGLLYALIMEHLNVYDSVAQKEDNKASKRQQELADNFLGLLVEHCNQERNVGFYADKLCVTPKYLSATVRQVTGYSVLEWIHSVLLLNSKMLLKNTSKTISEICDELNVSNDSFFCRFFKEQTGMSPLQYRKSA